MTDATVFPLADFAGDPDRADLAWLDSALCTQVDPELFFPEKGQPVTPARRVCMACEVRTECLDYALSLGGLHGIWGGLSERERRDLRQRRKGEAA